MTQHVETIIVGGGQAGLATSYCLTRLGREHLVLEQSAQAANAWRNGRWDSFALLTPNWAFRLPGASYDGPEPDGFMPRDEIVSRLERYVAEYDLPVRYQTRVVSVEPDPAGHGYQVQTEDECLAASNVVVATGLFQMPRIPTFSAGLPASVAQLHSGEYRNEQALPPGAVLVVGSGQSGCQIAEELYQAGRHVYLCVGSAGRVPRRYRGRDTFYWMSLVGFFERTPDKLPSPRARFAANPHVSGKNGGHTLSLHQFARDGVTLLGHLTGASDGRIGLAPDLPENLAKADRFELELLKSIDTYIEEQGLDAPQERPHELRDGYEQPVIQELDLARAGIRSVVWTGGYRWDFNLVKLPVLDADGFPVTRRGATAYPGLYFVGLPWLHKMKSGLFLGVGEDAAYIAEQIAAGGGSGLAGQ